MDQNISDVVNYNHRNKYEIKFLRKDTMRN